MNDDHYSVYQVLSCFDDLLRKSSAPGDYNAIAHLVSLVLEDSKLSQYSRVRGLRA